MPAEWEKGRERERKGFDRARGMRKGKRKGTKGLRSCPLNGKREEKGNERASIVPVE
ncbi:hypothetical protein GCM10009865_40230 [Aeromicrobium ponti]